MSSEQEIHKLMKKAVLVRREDIAQAKQFVMKDAYPGIEGIIQRWFSSLKVKEPEGIVFPSTDFEDTIERIARCFSLKLALYQGVWELIASAQIAPIEAAKEWVPEIGYRIHNMKSGTRFDFLKSFYIPLIHRLPEVLDFTPDTDIFLQGINCTELDEGIRQAVDESLVCFRRGLYLPATVMLAAAVEATWTECGIAVAAKLSNSKLEGIVSDQFASIGKIVAETRKALESAEAKPLLKACGQSLVKVSEAEQWTTVIRERRNALHWGKARSFIADHGGTASLLLGAPQHLGTLEAIRTSC